MVHRHTSRDRCAEPFLLFKSGCGTRICPTLPVERCLSGGAHRATTARTWACARASLVRMHSADSQVHHCSWAFLLTTLSAFRQLPQPTLTPNQPIYGLLRLPSDGCRRSSWPHLSRQTARQELTELNSAACLYPSAVRHPPRRIGRPSQFPPHLLLQTPLLLLLLHLSPRL